MCITCGNYPIRVIALPSKWCIIATIRRMTQCEDIARRRLDYRLHMRPLHVDWLVHMDGPMDWILPSALAVAVSVFLVLFILWLLDRRRVVVTREQTYTQQTTLSTVGQIYTSQTEITAKLDQIKSGTDEAVRMAQEAFSTSVAALHASNLAAHDTKKALDVISTTVMEDRNDLQKTLVRAMEDNRTVNRAVVTAVQGIVDTMREEMSASRGTTAEIPEVVKVLRTISADLNETVTTLRDVVPETRRLQPAPAIAEQSDQGDTTEPTGTPQASDGAEATGWSRPANLQRGYLQPLGPDQTSEAPSAESPRRLGPNTEALEEAGGEHQAPEWSNAVDLDRYLAQSGRQSRAGGSPSARPAVTSNDAVELLTLYAATFAELVASYQSAQALSDVEIAELASTYRSTWVSRLKSLHDRHLPTEVWQRFYMYAIAVQTINDFKSELEGKELEMAAAFWEDQVRSATTHREVYRKIAEELNRHLQETKGRYLGEGRMSHEQDDDLLDRQVS